MSNESLLQDSQKAYSCPLCMSSIYYKSDVKLYFGDPCGHKFCSECSLKASNKKSSAGGVLKTNNSVCPVCHSFVKYVEEYEYGETDFLRLEGAARKQVYAIMNESRSDFKDTPCYDSFLEKREDIINKLIYGNEAERKSTQDLLNQITKENQIAILERRTREETLLKNTVHEIVQQEGIFYEQLNQLSQNSTIDHLQIVHPLQNEYPEFFQNFAGKTTPKASTPNNGINSLGTNVPSPIDKSVTSRDHLLSRSRENHSFSVETRQRAGGFTENIVWSLCKNELFFGFYPSK
ncbi:CDK-activating kinase assembly factor MAT1 protein [Cryptosporidium felis]|nr:CDK-activating kinase assembly factor MAT1 protein [Cryptosporidium felis]